MLRLRCVICCLHTAKAGSLFSHPTHQKSDNRSFGHICAPLTSAAADFCACCRWHVAVSNKSLQSPHAVDLLTRGGHALQIMAPYAQWDIPVIGQSYLLFRAKLVPPYAFSPGTESLETQLFEPEDIPFDKVCIRCSPGVSQGGAVLVSLQQFCGGLLGWRVQKFSVIVRHASSGSVPAVCPCPCSIIATLCGLAGQCLF